MKQDILFEIGCEELPSQSVKPLAEALASSLRVALEEKSLKFETLSTYATPRRLAVWVKQVDDVTAAEVILRKGPSQDQPEAAIQGFARSCGVDLQTLELREGRYYYEVTRPGLKTESILVEMFQQLLSKFPIAKPMYWETHNGPFVRPVHWVVLLWGKEVIPGTFYGIQTGRMTHGHRFHHPEACEISEPSLYEALLENKKVIPAFEKRRETIIHQLNALAEANQAAAVMPEALLDEVTSIVEWPQAVLAHFKDSFLALPREVLIASMQVHLKCFALERPRQNTLLPAFIVIANIESKQPSQLIRGNEQVMQARLSDAAFFFEQDRKQPLLAWGQALEQTLFQAKLGTVADQLNRMQTLLSQWHTTLDLDLTALMRALTLSKCDLMTGMVGEFPELQGIIGTYYARLDGESDAVALAMNEQYFPRFSSDQLPTGDLGFALSLVNRIDVLVGIFGIGGKPSGMKDPFKLRRHALAVLRLLANSEKPLYLSHCIDTAIQAYPAKLLDPKALLELKPFILERLPAYYASQGVAADIVNSVVSVQSEWIFDLDRRIQALVSQRPHLEPLLGGSKRVNHLLKGLTQSVSSEVDPSLFKESAETALFQAMLQVEKDNAEDQHRFAYAEILQRLTTLRTPIDAFFDSVRVMVEDEAIQLNRLKMLTRLQMVLSTVADLSCL